jgi:hypothetical protein
VRPNRVRSPTTLRPLWGRPRQVPSQRAALTIQDGEVPAGGPLKRSVDGLGSGVLNRAQGSRGPRSRRTGQGDSLPRRALHAVPSVHHQAGAASASAGCRSEKSWTTSQAAAKEAPERLATSATLSPGVRSRTVQMSARQVGPMRTRFR